MLEAFRSGAQRNSRVQFYQHPKAWMWGKHGRLSSHLVPTHLPLNFSKESREFLGKVARGKKHLLDFFNMLDLHDRTCL